MNEIFWIIGLIVGIAIYLAFNRKPKKYELDK